MIQVQIINLIIQVLFYLDDIDSGEKQAINKATCKDPISKRKPKTRPFVLNNSIADEFVIDMSDVEGFENDVLAANGYGVALSSVKAKRSWDMDRWPAFLRLCGIVNDREIAPGLRAGETDFPLSCARWEYEMSGEKLFGPSCLGARVNRVAGRAVITNRTIPVYPKRVQWRVCHGWCRDPRVAYPTCLATSLDRNPMY